MPPFGRKLEDLAAMSQAADAPKDWVFLKAGRHEGVSICSYGKTVRYRPKQYVAILGLNKPPFGFKSFQKHRFMGYECLQLERCDL
ncbi:hypothetical protein HPP92_015532 [Vanilla planifolia]|uniref:Uncharacterized protein n=1 Tax=Vanilla planifolia TaxID=51239 RepID=A0A835QI32_VANPL|nr:hypothetical protein HPP92_015532 [Vanilla planifolia]